MPITIFMKMEREAKLYFLHKEWKPLVSMLVVINYVLLSQVTIFRIQPLGEAYFYAIISLSPVADGCIVLCGGKETDENDCLLLALRNYRPQPVFGNLGNVEHIRLLPQKASKPLNRFRYR